MRAPTTRAGASRISALRRRRGVLGCAGLAAIAALAAGCGSSSSPGAQASSATAPACLPATLDASAKLAGVPVDATPAPGTGTADPNTQISFLGVPAAQIREVSVVGSSSGRHAGALRTYSQGDGASFVPAAPFKPGEQVSVHAVIGAGAGAKPVAFGFHIDTPYPTAAVGVYANPPAPAADYQSFDTLPGVQAPILTVTAADRDPAAGDVFMTNGPGAGAYGPLIYTPQGRLVWFDQLSGGLTAEDLSVQSYEGQRDLTFWLGRVVTLGFGQGEDVVMNSHYQTVATVGGGDGLKADLHEFQVAPDNIAYITSYNPIHCDLRSAGGTRNGVITDSAVQEIDIKTGLVRWAWHTLDHVGVGEAETSPPTGFPWDWFHLNSIDLEPSGDILISARNTWAVYQIQGGSGRILWRLGGLKSSFKMGPGTTTRWQHDARMLPNGDITIYDDESPPAPADSQARGVTIALDLMTHQARLVSALTHANPALRADSQGNMQTLADGNTVVAFGGVPEITEYGKNGSLLLDAHLAYDLIFYRSFRYPWSARPSSPPALVANLDNVSQTIVHMSWNGATDVASWRVLAGRQRGSLLVRATVADSGFESSTVLPDSFAYAAVQALDSAGNVLATSHTVRVGTYAASLPTARRPG
jgi:hypothetical protein